MVYEIIHADSNTSYVQLQITKGEPRHMNHQILPYVDVQ